MVPDTPDVEDVLFGVGGVAHALRTAHGEGRKVIVDKRSISPMATQSFALGKNITLVGGNGDGRTTQVAQLMQAFAAHGMADLDHSALVRSLELLADHDVAPG